MTDADESLRPPVQLGYADPVLQRRQLFQVLFRALHVRQVGFAAGLALASGGLGYAIGDLTNTNSETPVCMTAGGILVGLSIPIPRRARE